MIIAIYTPCPDEETANKLSNALLEKKLIACANIFPIQSAYWWEGDVAREGEVVALMKSVPSHWKALTREIEQIHPYEVPCIARIEMHANEAYENWVREETRS